MDRGRWRLDSTALRFCFSSTASGLISTLGLGQNRLWLQRNLGRFGLRRRFRLRLSLYFDDYFLLDNGRLNRFDWSTRIKYRLRRSSFSVVLPETGSLTNASTAVSAASSAGSRLIKTRFFRTSTGIVRAFPIESEDLISEVCFTCQRNLGLRNRITRCARRRQVRFSARFCPSATDRSRGTC